VFIAYSKRGKDMEDIARLSSGIPGLDRNIEDGFPNPMILLLEGEPGTGKSTFALQMLMHQCEGKNRIYFSGISEPFENMKRNMGRHRFFRGDLIEGGTIHFIDIGKALGMGAEARLTPIRESEIELGEPFTTIISKIKEHRPDMVVIDPLLTSFSAESLKYRKIIYDFYRVIRELGVFLLIVKENTDPTARSVDNYMADGVMTLAIRPIKDRPTEYRKVMRIAKLRGTDHTDRLLQVDKDDEGMSMVTLEQDIIGSVP
jgi:circadian clock protein KaiC